MAKKKQAAAETAEGKKEDIFDEQIAQREREKTAQEATDGKPAKKDRPRSTTLYPLAHAEGQKQSDGEVARYFDDRNSGGVSARIDSPDKEFRPSPHVNEPLKEEHEGRNKMRWKDMPQFDGKRRWHKEVKNNPIGERLDAEERFEEMVKRRKEEIAGQEQAR
jgi:hypothetical protein